jgi:hypothetical protein
MWRNGWSRASIRGTRACGMQHVKERKPSSIDIPGVSYKALERYVALSVGSLLHNKFRGLPAKHWNNPPSPHWAGHWPAWKRRGLWAGRNRCNRRDGRCVTSCQISANRTFSNRLWSMLALVNRHRLLDKPSGIVTAAGDCCIQALLWNGSQVRCGGAFDLGSFGPSNESRFLDRGSTVGRYTEVVAGVVNRVRC